MKCHLVAGVVSAALVLQSARAGAQQPPPARESSGADASAGTDRDGGSSGAAPIGWILAIGGGAATAIGAGILVAGAFAEAEDTDQATFPTQTALDPGIGRAGVISGNTGTPADADSLAGYDVAAAVMGVGALTLGIGIYLIFTGDEPSLPKSEPAAAARAPRVWRSGRTTGLAFQF